MLFVVINLFSDQCAFIGHIACVALNDHGLIVKCINCMYDHTVMCQPNGSEPQ